MTSTPDPGGTFIKRCDFFAAVLAEWLVDDDVTLACGRWAEGAVAEWLPRGQARLLPRQYDQCFAGVRELRLEGTAHHMHIDFGRIHKVSYAVAPSVCLGFRPSLDVRFLATGAGGAPTDRWALAVMLGRPYGEDGLRPDVARRFLARAHRQARERPDLVEFVVDDAVRTAPGAEAVLASLSAAIPGGVPAVDWGLLAAEIAPRPAPAAPPDVLEPFCLPILKEALGLADASLVVYRDRTLVEFKTELLDDVHRYEEQGHVSWQIGASDDHHCHLALGAVTRILFSAEAVTCQGGALNYTIWFLTDGPSGNPWRRDGYFSVTLNRPYRGRLARRDIVQPLLDVYRRHAGHAAVSADDIFRRVLDDGIPDRDVHGHAAA